MRMLGAEGQPPCGSCCGTRGNDTRIQKRITRRKEARAVRHWEDEYVEREPLPCPLYASDETPYAACTC